MSDGEKHAQMGAWVNGTNAWLIVGMTAAGIALVTLVGIFVSGRNRLRADLVKENVNG